MPAHPRRTEIRLLDGRFYADDPHRWFDWMRAHAPVYRDETADPAVWGVTLYEDVMAVSKDARTFSNAQGMRPEALEAEVLNRVTRLRPVRSARVVRGVAAPAAGQELGRDFGPIAAAAGERQRQGRDRAQGDHHSLRLTATSESAGRPSPVVRRTAPSSLTTPSEILAKPP